MIKEKSKGKGCCKLNKVVLSLSTLIMLIALALSSYGAPHTQTLNTLTWRENSIINLNELKHKDFFYIGHFFYIKKNYKIASDYFSIYINFLLPTSFFTITN